MGSVATLPARGASIVRSGRLVPGATTVVFQHEDHWLYIENFMRFATLVADFAENGMLTEDSRSA